MKQLFYTGLLLAIALFVGCGEDDDTFINPYDQIDEEIQQDSTDTELDPTSLAGLHANIFIKTCANSGCHDGTFEPDFRTVESSYNTLVNHPIIKNDPQNSFEVRVLPGDAAASQLVTRLEKDIDDNSGIMPLIIEPDSDWPEKREEYIQNIKDWIAAGAKDALGN